MVLHGDLLNIDIDSIYVCYGDEINELSIFAYVVKETVDGVFIKRFLKYGLIEFGSVSLYRFNFNKYYKRLVKTPDYIKSVLRSDRFIESELL